MVIIVHGSRNRIVMKSGGIHKRNPVSALRESIDYLFSTYEIHIEIATDIDCNS
jgi:hypothetical protein